MKDGITESERDQKYTSLVEAESEASDKLDDAIKAECLWFVEAQLTADDLRALSKLYPSGHRLHRSEATLTERKKMGEAIPATRWNPSLSYAAHAEAAKIRDPETRWTVIESPPVVETTGEPALTGTEMAVAVTKVRRDLGEVRTPTRCQPGKPTPMTKLNHAQGWVVSDQSAVAKGMSTMDGGEVVVNIKQYVPESDQAVRVLGTPQVAVLGNGREVQVRYDVAVTDDE